MKLLLIASPEFSTRISMSRPIMRERNSAFFLAISWRKAFARYLATCAGTGAGMVAAWVPGREE
jgi:hypothetical protein